MNITLLKTSIVIKYFYVLSFAQNLKYLKIQCINDTQLFSKGV